MMKRFKSIYLLAIAATLSFTACSSDSEDVQGGEQPTVQEGKAKVTLRIATDNGKATTRAWEDINAKTYPDRTEMMYSWIVLITDGNAIKYKFSGTPADAKAEIDDVCTDVEMASGTYTVYSFANISETSLKTILGVSSLNAGTALTDATVTAATATINGNGFVPSESNGIPMSNKQTLDVPVSGSVSKDLIVVRMLAKITLSVKNQTGAAVTIKKITLSDVTDNAANNLKLLPKLTRGADDMDAVHKDIQPNLNGTPATVSFSPTLATGGVAIANNNNEPKDITFYVNESATPTNSDHLFNLTLELNNAEYRYSIINQNGKTSGDNGAWDYIARNDYRVLPIVLDDYKFQIIPYDFPAIGVYPASVKAINESENLYEMTFHDYGHFHLLPKVTKGASTQVKYNAGSGDYWTLNTDFAGSWFTAATKDDAWLNAAGITSNGFYRNQTATADADEAGGAPVWYLNDGVAGPQWDPAGSTTSYQPFIFGYIKDPNGPLSSDLKIYHEMKIKLYVGGAYRRDMIYRFYMTLSKDQMSYPSGGVTPGGSSRGLGVERPRLPHNHIWK